MLQRFSDKPGNGVDIESRPGYLCVIKKSAKKSTQMSAFLP